MLTVHSAYDAYMLLIEGAGKRILYTGDFRRHGRKSSLVDAMMSKPPANVDVLLTEGTNLGSEKPVKTETDLEADFVELFARTKGRVFVSWSGQNIDRTVTLYRAAKRTGRNLAIDLYTADVLDRISEGTGLPRAGYPNLDIVITSGLSRTYRRQGRQEFVERMVPHGISARRLEGGRHAVMLRRALIQDYMSAGVIPSADDAFNFSMWKGYLSQPYHSESLEWCKSREPRLPTFTPVATLRQPISAPLPTRFVRKPSCPCMASNGTKSLTDLARCDALPMRNAWCSSDEGAVGGQWKHANFGKSWIRVSNPPVRAAH